MESRVLGVRKLYRDALTRRWLDACDRIGERTVLRGRPHFHNDGRIVIGDDFRLESEPIQSHLVVGRDGVVQVGDRVSIRYGLALSCVTRIEIGNGARIGAFAIFMDSDFHVAGDLMATAEARAIRIGEGARIGHRVVLLPGSVVESGAMVLSGSVVSGKVLAGTVVSGNPARASGGEPDVPGAAGPDDVPALIQRVLGLKEIPAAASGPQDYAEWDSLGALRLILALEETFQVSLREDELKAVRSVGDVMSLVGRAQERRS